MIEEGCVSKIRAISEVILISFLIVLTGIILFDFTKLPDVLPYRVMGTVYCIVTFAIVAVMVKFVAMTSFSDIGFIFKPIVKKCLLGFAIGLGFIGLEIEIFIIFFGMQIEDILRGEVSLNIAILQTLYYYIFVAVSEEAIFRGFIFHRLNKAFNSKILISIVTSLLFMAFHYRSLNAVQAIETFALSVTYCIVLYRSKDKSIFPLIIAHGFIDSLPIWLGILFFY